jgi:hypothetical protein
MIDWTNAEAANALQLAHFFEDVLQVRGLSADAIDPSFPRRLYAWKYESKNVELDTVDRWATTFGYHLSELPRCIWRYHRTPRGRQKVAA